MSCIATLERAFGRSWSSEFKFELKLVYRRPTILTPQIFRCEGVKLQPSFKHASGLMPRDPQ
jgi:hypothetical protein